MDSLSRKEEATSDSHAFAVVVKKTVLHLMTYTLIYSNNHTVSDKQLYCQKACQDTYFSQQKSLVLLFTSQIFYNVSYTHEYDASRGVVTC